jgi:hypothetical protein
VPGTLCPLEQFYKDSIATGIKEGEDLRAEGPEALPPEILTQIEALAEQYRFFHWHLELLDVFGDAGDGGLDDIERQAINRQLGGEGFLPGYAFPPQAAILSFDDREDELARDPAIALTEYAPGNFVYYRGRQYEVTHARPRRAGIAGRAAPHGPGRSAGAGAAPRRGPPGRMRASLLRLPAQLLQPAGSRAAGPYFGAAPAAGTGRG